MKKSIKKLWLSRRLKEIRRELLKGNREISEVCKSCNETRSVKDIRNIA